MKSPDPQKFQQVDDDRPQNLLLRVQQDGAQMPSAGVWTGMAVDMKWTTFET